MHCIPQAEIGRGTLDDYSSDSYLGHCWAMNGSVGHIAVRIDRPIRAKTVIIEHAPARVTPEAGSSAPRKFRLVVSIYLCMRVCIYSAGLLWV